MTAALSWLFYPLNAAINFFHWDAFNKVADELWESQRGAS